MGNNFSQEVGLRNLRPIRGARTHPHTHQTKVSGLGTTDLWVCKPSGYQIKRRSTGTSTKESAYATSCLYRRKVYADSLSKLKLAPRALPSGVAKPFPRSTQNSRSAQSARRSIDVSIANKQNFILRPLQEPPIMRLFNQQWNANNWADYRSVTSQDSCGSLNEMNTSSSKVAKSLPKLLSVHHLMEKLDDELSRSRVLIKQTVDDLINTDTLLSRSTAEQRGVIRKAEESAYNTQNLLVKVHQHIANTHEFCNMLHRVDESLQIFSKTADSVTTWRRVKQDAPFERVE